MRDESRGERRTREEWAALVEAYEASGESQRGFCAARAIGQSSLRYWRRRLRDDEESARSPARLIPVKVLSDPPASGGSGVTVVTGAGVRIEVARDFDAPTLARVLASVQRVA